MVDNLDVKEAKTKALKEQLGKLGFGKTALVIDGDALNVGFALAVVATFARSTCCRRSAPTSTTS